MASGANNRTPLVSSIIRFPVRGDSSRFLKSSPSLIAEYYPLVGFNGGFSGAEVEFEEKGGEADKTPIHWMLNWNSYEDALAFTDQSNFPSFAAKILESSRLPRLYHVSLNAPPPEKLYSSPAIESVRITLVRGIDKTVWGDKFTKFEAALVQSAPGYISHTTGWVLGEEYEFFVMIGWESVKAHRDWTSVGEGKKLVDEFISVGIAEFDMVHLVSGEIIHVKV